MSDVASDRRHRFHEMHAEGLFVIPNPWDVGSARLLVSLGFPALATTSSGHAATLGKRDQHATLDELVEHCTLITAAVDVPLNVDSEYCFADDLAGISRTVDRIAGSGAAGLSIEDFDPAARRIDPVDKSTERVAAAAEAARRHGLVLTARAENHVYGVDDLDDTVARLSSYREAGADVVYAPGLVDLDDIARVVGVGAPVNVLARANGPSVAELAAVGVRRVSTGGGLARAAYSALLVAGRELADAGTSTYLAEALAFSDIAAAFD
ncbi:MAG: isocitrate lyase/PEP mutase family protein [Acidimicrobiales bacterium]